MAGDGNAIACRHCATVNPASAEFCSNCGARLHDAPLTATPAGNAFIVFLMACFGVVAGTLVGAFLLGVFFVAANTKGNFHFTIQNQHVVQIATIALGVVGVFALLATYRSRALALQVFLISMLLTALGAFALCSSIWIT
jgi:zinc ribbon protein